LAHFSFGLILVVVLWPLRAALIGLGIEAYKMIRRAWADAPFRLKVPFEKIPTWRGWEGAYFRRLRPL
jgi:hypothetical protein